MGTKVHTTQYSWKAIVEAADPDRNKRRPVYEFSNGRKFTGTAPVARYLKFGTEQAYFGAEELVFRGDGES